VIAACGVQFTVNLEATHKLEQACEAFAAKPEMK
jgi:hypothetical protein